MNQKLITTLLDLGLRENEANLYLAGLKLGATTILDLSRESEIKRSTIYGIIENLKQKGLCYEQMDGWKKSYVMSEPIKLKNILETKKLELDKILPEFEAVTNLDQRSSSVEYYKGLEGIKTVYQEILDTIRDDNFKYILGDLKFWYDLDPVWFDNFLKERTKLSKKYNYKIRAIFQKDERSIMNQKNEDKMNMEIKLINQIKDISNILITQDFVLIQQYTDPIHGIVIRNTGAAKMQKEMFEMLWDKL